jgi:hypothetical protein
MSAVGSLLIRVGLALIGDRQTDLTIPSGANVTLRVAHCSCS